MGEQISNSLFPPYLNEGSSGDAVTLLQQLLFGCSPTLCRELQVTGSLTGPWVQAVRKLQEIDLGFSGDDVDGNFGPGTREVFLKCFNINVDLIPATDKSATTWISPKGPQGVWPKQD